MQKRADYSRKMYSELETAETRLADFKAKVEKLTAGDREEHGRHVEKIEKNVEATKAELRKLDEAHDSVWEEFADGVENTWKDLQDSLEDAVTSFGG